MRTTATCLFALAVACTSSGTPSAGFDQPEAGPGDDGGPPAVSYTLRIDPPNVTADVPLGAAPPSFTFHAFAKPIAGGPEADVTSATSWGLDNAAIGAMSPAGALGATGAGGKGTVSASYQNANASAPIALRLTGDVFAVGTDPGAVATFGGASPDPSTANKPAFEYPDDGVTIPSNLPAPNLQWSVADDANLWRVHFTAPGILDVTAYAATRELALDPVAWTKVRASVLDASLAVTVDGVGPKKLVRTSDPRNIAIAADTIDDSVMYVWKTSEGRFRVLDIVTQKELDFPNDVPVLQPNPPACSGCHVVSRDGKRFAYVYNGGNFQFGTLAYDDAKQTFASKLAADPVNLYGTHASFNPMEATTRSALLVSSPDPATINKPQSPGNVILKILDPDTGAELPSNLAAIMGALAPPNGPSALMPDWSPTGDFVVFAAYDSSKYHVRLVGDEVTLTSLMEMSVTYDAAKGFVFGTPKVLVQAPPNGNPDTDETNFLPTLSPDGAAVAFTRSNGWWSLATPTSPMNLTGRIAIVRRSDGTVIELAGGSNGPDKTWHSTWPQWAPTMGKRFAWLAYSTQRPYGHLLTPASPENASCTLIQGQTQCKHLWIMAVDRQKLASGTADPSLPPFWVPGQSIAAQYVSPQWTKAVLPVK